MQGKSAEGLPADLRESLAANDDFAASVVDLESLSGGRSGWDPYDVWLTRVKNSAVHKDREADQRR